MNPSNGQLAKLNIDDCQLEKIFCIFCEDDFQSLALHTLIEAIVKLLVFQLYQLLTLRCQQLKTGSRADFPCFGGELICFS